MDARLDDPIDLAVPHLPIKDWGYWEHFIAWLNFLVVSMAFIDILIIGPLTPTP